MFIVTKSLTTSYHPQGNGRWGRTHAWSIVVDHLLWLCQACLPVEVCEMQLVPSLSNLRSLVRRSTLIRIFHPSLSRTASSHRISPCPSSFDVISKTESSHHVPYSSSCHDSSCFLQLVTVTYLYLLLKWFLYLLLCLHSRLMPLQKIGQCMRLDQDVSAMLLCGLVLITDYTVGGGCGV